MRLVSAALLAAAAVVLLSGSPAQAASLRRRRAAVGTAAKSQADAALAHTLGLLSLQDVSTLAWSVLQLWGRRCSVSARRLDRKPAGVGPL